MRACALLLLTACATATATQPLPQPREFGSAATFAIDRAAIKDTPKLISKLDSSAYRYFRAIGPELASRTCYAFRDVRWHLPLVAIHGDAHLEQFVVTAETFGLEDFDQAGFGPAVVDLVRYAVSIRLACKDAKYECRADEAVQKFFAAYREALDKEPDRSHAPSIVARMRENVAQTRADWLAWADKQMIPLTAEEEEDGKKHWTKFVALMRDVRPDRDPKFFDLVRAGRLSMGIGSMLEKKILVRIRGESDDPSDDLILEARSAHIPQGDECSWRPPHGGSLYALMFMSLLGPRMPDVFGFVPLSDDPHAQELWVQAWDPGYRELSLSDIQSEAELEELANDAAHQLAGHFWKRFPPALVAHQRHAQLVAFDLVRDRAIALSTSFASEVLAAWEKFKAAK